MGQKIKKKVLKSNNFFDKNPFFCNFKNGQKSIFEQGKSLKLPEMQFHEKIFDLGPFKNDVTSKGGGRQMVTLHYKPIQKKG